MPYWTGAGFVIKTGILLCNLCWRGVRKIGQSLGCPKKMVIWSGFEFLSLEGLFVGVKSTVLSS